MHRGLLSLLGAFIALAAPACAPELTCDEEFSGGGDPLGAVDTSMPPNGVPDSKWVVTEPCEDIVSSPPLQDTLVGQPPHLSGETPPEPGGGDWCMNLSFNGDGTIQNLNTWFPRLPLQPHSPIAAGQRTWYNASLSLEGSTYSFAAILYGKQKLELSAKCLEAQGFKLTCEQLTPAIQMVWNSEPAVQNLVCAKDPSGSGCECFYDMVLNTGPTGTWAYGGDVITFYDGAGGPAFQANHRVEGNELNLSGYHRRTLFGINGMRTLKFERVICNDGRQGAGEDGVDCGPYCLACP